MRQTRKPREPRQPRDTRSYIELLRDPRWQKMRLQILERDRWMCTSCEETTKTLNVHHQRYERGKLPWEVNPDYLLTLCEPCHEAATHWKKEIDACLADVDPSSWGRVAGFIQGMALQSSVAGMSGVRIEDYEQAAGIAQAAAMGDGETVLARCKDRRYLFEREDFDELAEAASKKWLAERGRGPA